MAAGRSLAQSLSSVSPSADQSEHAQQSVTSNVEFVTVERAKHLVMMEQPDEVAQAIWKLNRYRRYPHPLISRNMQSEHAQQSVTSNVEFVTVKRAKHLVMMEQPDKVAQAI
jgi:pimeloyl-ACP methyl ester carboxylesterase